MQALLRMSDMIAAPMRVSGYPLWPCAPASCPARSSPSPCAASCLALPAPGARRRGPRRAAPLPPADRLDIPANDDGLPGMGPLRRYAWFRKLWHDKRTQWATEVQQDQGAVVLLGDSITQGWNDRLPAGVPRHEGRQPRDQRRHDPRRADSACRTTCSPSTRRRVVLLIGTNDLEEGARPDVVESNVRLILAALRAHDPRMPIVLCQVFPSSAKMKRPSAIIKDTNARLLALVKNDPQVTPRRHLAPLGRRRTATRRSPSSPICCTSTTPATRAGPSALRPVLESLGLLAPSPDVVHGRGRLRAAVQRPRPHRLGLSRDDGAGEGVGGEVAGLRSRMRRCGRS